MPRITRKKKQKATPSPASWLGQLGKESSTSTSTTQTSKKPSKGAYPGPPSTASKLQPKDIVIGTDKTKSTTSTNPDTMSDVEIMSDVNKLIQTRPNRLDTSGSTPPQSSSPTNTPHIRVKPKGVTTNKPKPSTTSTSKSGTTGGFLQDKISSGQMSLGVDKTMPKLDRTISNATSTSHDIISSSKPSGRVGRVKRRQEQRTANLAGRLQGRAQKASDKATIDATRTSESGKRQGMRAKAKGPDMPQASSTSAKPSGVDKTKTSTIKPTTLGAEPTFSPPKGKEKITLDKTSKANRRGGGTVSQDALVSQTKKEQTQRKVDASFGKEVKGSKSQTSSDWLGAKTYSDVSTMVRRAGGTPSGGSESPKQQAKNDLMDMPVDKDATGGRSGSQFSYGSQAEQDKATHDKYGVTTRGKKVIKVKGF